MARACTTCAKAKARCIPGAGSGSRCERCCRLDKQCSSRPPAPPRAKKRVKRSRVAELEKRLDELSSQFDQPSSAAAEGCNANAKASSTPPAVRMRAASTSAASASASCKPGITPIPISLTHIFQAPTSGAMVDSDNPAGEDHAQRPWHSLWPQPGEADKLLECFHTTMADLFPFVIVPRTVKEMELRLRRPFLWKAIMLAGTLWDGPRQVELGHRLLADISNAAIVDGRQNLDILQGLMLLIAWFHYALKSTQMTHLLFLARSMCVDLGVKGGSTAAHDSKATDQNLDHYRAFAGTYYLNTLVFTTNKRTDVFMETSLLETCCASLDNAKQYPSDEFLIQLVRIQQIAQSISTTMAFDPGQPPSRLPLLMVVESFQSQLDAFRASIPLHLKDNKPLSTHISIAEVLLLDFAISDQHCNSVIMPLADRLRLLWSCVSSLRAFLTVRFASQDKPGPRFLGMTSSDLAYVIITGMKLLTLRLPGWNLEHIAKELRLGQLIQRQIEELEADIVCRHNRDGGPAPSVMVFDEPWERILRLLKNVRELIRTQLETTGLDTGSYTDVAQGSLNDFSEAVWQEIMNESLWTLDGNASQFGLG